MTALPAINPYVSLAADVIVLLAIGAAIFYAARLSRQIRAMQADRKAFDLLIQALNLACAKAEGAVRNMKEAAEDADDSLQKQINKARALTDELEIMLQAGDSLAARLQKTAEKARTLADAPAAAAAAPHAEETQDSPARAPRSRAEKELLEALKAKQS